MWDASQRVNDAGRVIVTPFCNDGRVIMTQTYTRIGRVLIVIKDCELCEIVTYGIHHKLSYGGGDYHKLIINFAQFCTVLLS